MDDIAWPQGIPKPAPGLRITDRQRKATFDLVFIAGAWMFAHEVRHQIYECQENVWHIRFAEEVECDRWALRLLLDDAGTCVRRTIGIESWCEPLRLSGYSHCNVYDPERNAAA